MAVKKTSFRTKRATSSNTRRPSRQRFAAASRIRIIEKSLAAHQGEKPRLLFAYTVGLKVQFP